MSLTARAERKLIRRRPVDKCSADELLEELVADAVAGYATPLDRFVRACDRIGRLEDCGAEGAYQKIRTEVFKLTGRPFMPMVS